MAIFQASRELDSLPESPVRPASPLYPGQQDPTDSFPLALNVDATLQQMLVNAASPPFGWSANLATTSQPPGILRKRKQAPSDEPPVAPEYPAFVPSPMGKLPFESPFKTYSPSNWSKPFTTPQKSSTKEIPFSPSIFFAGGDANAFIFSPGGQHGGLSPLRIETGIFRGTPLRQQLFKTPIKPQKPEVQVMSEQERAPRPAIGMDIGGPMATRTLAELNTYVNRPEAAAVVTVTSPVRKDSSQAFILLRDALNNPLLSQAQQILASRRPS